MFKRKADGVANRGTAVINNADESGFDKLARGVHIKTERHLQGGARGVNDNADTVSASRFNKINRHRLGGFQAIDALPFEHKVLRVHTVGDIKGEHQVAPALRNVSVLLYPLRSRRRGN